MQIKKLLLVLALLLPPLALVSQYNFRGFGTIGWYVLIGVMSVRPLADLLPRIKILRGLLAFRREFGIFAGMMILGHFTGFLLANKLSVFAVFFDREYWDFKHFIAWGMLGMLAALPPPLLTSNNFMVSLLKGKWKWIQRFSYFLVLFAGIHMYMLGEKAGIIGIIIVFTLWTSAKIKIILRNRKKQSTDYENSK